MDAPTFADYTLESPIGTGGFAQVWRAKAPEGEEVALKIIRPEGGASAVLRAQLESQLEARIDSTHVLLPRKIVRADDGRIGGVSAPTPGETKLDPAFLEAHYPKLHDTFQAWVASQS